MEKLDEPVECCHTSEVALLLKSCYAGRTSTDELKFYLQVFQSTTQQHCCS